MPLPALRSMAKRYGVPMAKAESFWRGCRETYGDDFRAVMGCTKKKMQNAAKSRRGGRAALGT